VTVPYRVDAYKRQNEIRLIGVRLGDVRSLLRASSQNGLRVWGRCLILSKWFLLTRLETRTKESNTYASLRVEKLIGLMKVSIRCDYRKVCNTDRPWSSVKGSSKSIFVRTRKMVNYAWVGWSQGKLWWKLVAILTCKSIVKLGYRGERLIEPSSSWFPLKFLSG